MLETVCASIACMMHLNTIILKMDNLIRSQLGGYFITVLTHQLSQKATSWRD